MVPDDTQGGTSGSRAQAIGAVVEKTLVFGETSAQHVGVETFNDQIMHTYFLFFIYGALDALSATEELGVILTDAEKASAMSEALLSFGTTSNEQIIATIRMLQRAHDDAALKIKQSGADAAREWKWGTNEAATRRFLELMDDPENFPREVAPIPGPLGPGVN